MSKIQKNLNLAVKGILCFYLPVIVLIYIIYEVIFKIDMLLYWDTILMVGILVGLLTVRIYSRKRIEQDAEDFNSLNDSINEDRWEIIEQNENTLILKPRFDFPFRLLIDNTVKVDYAVQTANIEGPWNYAYKLKKDIGGKSNIWLNRTISIIGFVVIIFLVSVPILEDIGLFWEIKAIRHNNYVKNIETIKFNPEEVIGNTIGNTNNYGGTVENDNYIFYVEDYLNLVRVNKDFQDKEYIIQKGNGSDINRLNIVGNWIYYVSGETINRISVDGSDNETIYKSSYVMDIHIKGNWIYFINFYDNFNIYRMDLNGRNLERFLRVNAADLAVYDDRMIFSHENDSKGCVESIKLDGSDRRLEFEGICTDLIKLDDYYYYIGDKYNLYRRSINESTSPQILVDDKVSSYIIADENIYYSLHSEDVGYPGKGFYRIGSDGSDDTLLLNSENVERFGNAGNWILFHTSENNLEAGISRLNILTNEIEIIK